MAALRRGTVRATVEVDGTTRAKREMKELEGSFQAWGKGGVAGVTSELQKLSPQMGAMTSALGPLKTAIGASAAIWGAWAAAVGAAGAAYGALAMRGGEVSAVATAFERVASPELLGRMSEATGGLVAEVDLMRNATRALRTELVSEEEYTQWAAIVTRAAQDMDRDVVASLESLTGALSGGGMEAFSQLGLNMQRIQGRVREMGESMETERGRVIALRAAMEEAERVFGRVDNAASNLNDVFASTTVQTRNWVDQVARIAAESPAAVGALGALNEHMGGFGSTSEAAGRAIAQAMQLTIRSLALGTEAATRFFGTLASGWEGFFRTIARFGASGSVWAGDYNRLADGARAWADQLNGVADAAEAVFDAAGAAAVAAPTAPVAGGGGGGGGVGPQPSGRGGAARGASVAEQAADARQALIDFWKAYDQVAIDATARALEAEHALQAKRVEDQQEQVRLLQEVEQKRIENLQAERDRQQAAHEEQMAREDAYQQLLEQRRDRLQAAFGAAEGFARSMNTIFGQIANSLEQQGKKADGWRKAEGVALGIMYTIKAIAAGADAVANFASQNYAGGVLAIAAAAEYGVAAGMAYSKLAGSGGAAAPRVSAGSFTPTSQAQTAPEATGGGGNTYVHYSLGYDEPDMARAMRRAEWRLDKAGGDQPGNRAVRFAS